MVFDERVGEYFFLYVEKRNKQVRKKLRLLFKGTGDTSILNCSLFFFLFEEEKQKLFLLERCILPGKSRKRKRLLPQYNQHFFLEQGEKHQ